MDTQGSMNGNLRAQREAILRREEGSLCLKWNRNRPPRQFGLPISYLDEHMGVGWLPGLREQLRRFAEREGLFDAAPIPFLSLPPTYGDDPKTALLATLETLAPGTCVYVTHPGFDEADMQAFVHPGLEPGSVARERDAERRLLCDPEVRRFLLERTIEVVRYSEIAPK